MRTGAVVLASRLALIAGLSLPVAALGQEGMDQPAPPAPAAAPWTPPTFSDPQLAEIAKLLTGTWKTASPVAESSGQARTDVVMNIVPVRLGDDVADALYVEAARADALHAPYRQAIFQLYTFKGKPRLRTYEFFGSPVGPAVVGLWLAPEFFPQIPRSQLIATLDVELARTGDGWSGKTPYPYPTGVGGAVEMTSELTLSPGRMVSVDRGFDAAGKIVWGSGEGERYEFVRAEPGAKFTKTPEGVLIIEYARPTGGEEIVAGDRAFIHYTGWLTDGSKFDSSRDRGSPVPFDIAEGRLIPGFITGMLGATQGTMRRLIIPPAQGYGEAGAGRAIPPNSTLIFETEVMAIQKPTPQEPAPAPVPAPEGTPPEGTPPSDQPK
jgi:peptidylprolyl isomerase